MPSRWCPWCGGEITEGLEGAVITCAACGTRMPATTALVAPPQRPLRPDDPEAKLPPGEPEGSVPLPAGAATMSSEALVRYAVIFGAVVVAVGVLGLAIGRPVVSRLTAPTPVESPAPSLPSP